MRPTMIDLFDLYHKPLTGIDNYETAEKIALDIAREVLGTVSALSDCKISFLTPLPGPAWSHVGKKVVFDDATLRTLRCVGMTILAEKDGAKVVFPLWVELHEGAPPIGIIVNSVSLVQSPPIHVRTEEYDREEVREMGLELINESLERLFRKAQKASR